METDLLGHQVLIHPRKNNPHSVTNICILYYTTIEWSYYTVCGIIILTMHETVFIGSPLIINPRHLLLVEPYVGNQSDEHILRYICIMICE